MKKALLFLLAVPIILLAAEAQDPGGYLAAKWGMAPDQVKAAMPDKKWKSIFGKGLYYNDEIEKLSLQVWFDFTESKLWRVQLTPKPTMGSTMSTLGSPASGAGPSITGNVAEKLYAEKFIATYSSLQANLNTKYGAPKENKCNNQSNISDIKTAIIRGQADCYSIWELGDTRIFLQAKRQNGGGNSAGIFDAILIYSSLSIKPAGSPATQNKI